MSALGVGGSKGDKSLTNYYISKWKKTSQMSNKDKYLAYQQYKIILCSFPIQKKQRKKRNASQLLHRQCMHTSPADLSCFAPHTSQSIFVQDVCSFLRIGHLCLQKLAMVFYFILLFNLNVWELICLLACSRGLGCGQTRLNNSCWDF